MTSSPSHDAVGAWSRHYQIVLRFDGNRTAITLGPNVAIIAQGRAIDDNRSPLFRCNAAAQITRPHVAAPPPRIYFTDTDHAHRFAANTDGLWRADDHPLSRPQTCEYQLLRSGTTVPIPAGAPAFIANIDHLVHLAAYWFEVAIHDATSRDRTP